MSNRNSHRTKVNVNNGVPTIILFLVAAAMLGLLAFILHAQRIAFRSLVPLDVRWIVFGVLIGGKRLAGSWLDFLFTASASFIFSFSTFLISPSRLGISGYRVEKLIQTWPYAFIGIFIFSLILSRLKLPPSRLSLNTILLQFVSVCYWVLEEDFSGAKFLPIKLLIVAGLFFSIWVIVKAFRYRVSLGLERIMISAWSCILIIFLGINNIYNESQADATENSVLVVGLHYFVLGLSGGYILENFMLLTGLLPGRGKLLGPPYFSSLKDLREVHLNRYDQVAITAWSLSYLVISISFFLLNHHFQFVPKTTAILGVFVIWSFCSDLYRSWVV